MPITPRYAFRHADYYDAALMIFAIFKELYADVILSCADAAITLMLFLPRCLILPCAIRYATFYATPLYADYCC